MNKFTSPEVLSKNPKYVIARIGQTFIRQNSYFSNNPGQPLTVKPRQLCLLQRMWYFDDYLIQEARDE